MVNEMEPNTALQLPGNNCASGKLSMRGTLIPVRDLVVEIEGVSRQDVN